MKEEDAYKRAALDAFMYGNGYIYKDEEGAHYVDPRDVSIRINSTVMGLQHEDRTKTSE